MFLFNFPMLTFKITVQGSFNKTSNLNYRREESFNISYEKI